MELHIAIKEIVDQFGKEIIAEKRFINMVADYHSFKDNPAEKIVLTTLVNTGLLARLLEIPSGGDVSIVQRQIINDICNYYGFREDIVSKMIDCLTSCLGINTPKDDSLKENVLNNFQVNSRDLAYSEQYIMSLYPILFENVPYHAHMDFDVFKEKISLDSNEAFRLFKFLKGIGVYQFNPYSDDYDMNVDSKEVLRKLYRNYYVQNGVNQIPLSKEKLIRRDHLEAIIRKLYKFKRISEDDINSVLLSYNDSNEYAHELFKILQQLRVIDEMGRCLNPYLTPEAMVNNIIYQKCISSHPTDTNTPPPSTASRFCK